MSSHFLKNPHSILAVLQTRPKDVLECALPQKDSEGPWEDISRLAKNLRIPIKAPSHGARPLTKSLTLKGGAPKSFGSKQGPSEESQRVGLFGALVKHKEPLVVEELFKNASSRAGGNGLWLALDSLQDPQNVGAIFRSAAFFGVQGILLTQERSAPLTSVVYDIASGGIESVPFSIQASLQRSFEIAKEVGLWILGSSEHAHDDFRKVEADRPWLLVLGNEEKGMRRLTEESCDVLCRVSSLGKVTSLNVSVAAGILISHFSHRK